MWYLEAIKVVTIAFRDSMRIQDTIIYQAPTLRDQVMGIHIWEKQGSKRTVKNLLLQYFIASFEVINFSNLYDNDGLRFEF